MAPSHQIGDTWDGSRLRHGAGREMRRIRIELPTRAAADALAEYLQRCDCMVNRADECALNVSAYPTSQSFRDSQNEVDGYLRVWQTMHPTIHVKTFGLLG
jgi:hypothetical protein